MISSSSEALLGYVRASASISSGSTRGRSSKSFGWDTLPSGVVVGQAGNLPVRS